MSKPSRLFFVVALFVLGVVAVSQWNGPAAAQEKEKPRDKAPAAAVLKWEYRLIVVEAGGGAFAVPAGGGGGVDEVVEAEKKLNKLGEEGFEIAFVTSSQRSSSSKTGSGASHPVVYYTLKRAK